MKIGSLFSGIGGLELGLERAGLGHVVWQCEIDPFCRQVLAKHWPDVPRLSDVRVVSHETVEEVEVICGGFPCQDLSHAGKRAGLDGRRSGLWREFERVVDECQPRLVIVENVHHAWASWVPFVRSDLHDLGYSSVPLCVSAADVGADHLRRRVFIVANPDREFIRELAERFPGSLVRGTVRGGREAEPFDARWRTAASRMARVDDGFPVGLDVDRRRTAVPFLTHGEARRKALGNAVVPQCAEVIGRAIATAIETIGGPCG